VIHRIRVRRTLGAPRLGKLEFVPQTVGEEGNDLVLHLEEISDRLVEARPLAAFGASE
jgi:hypothetical protein